ncbi:hypothetical protein [Cellulomonas cellasea]|uniref:Uncharacterized protein n=1 Tax=Cellulomonas cellasea TaxID=43670 RepID=A0A7W4YCH4_9CELL|nr:hypothetical protein [Cellulomonas cellasea]MBB2924099.1 hypothetical protein [Cellulomonas cellasea]
MPTESKTPCPSRAAQGDQLAKLRWWGGALVVTALGLVTAVASWASGDRPGVVVMLLGLTLSCGATALRLREQYRLGWRHGFESAVRGFVERASGRTTTTPELRVVVHGDPIPEPWHPHLSLREERPQS